MCEVAEKSRVPLYTLSAGDLGTKADTVEKGLMKALDCCQLWNGVLLIDEADVFLKSRDMAAASHRNELVSSKSPAHVTTPLPIFFFLLFVFSPLPPPFRSPRLFSLFFPFLFPVSPPTKPTNPLQVFLRRLEYYRGVMFLTTNRLPDIDTAFKSRIDLIIPYSDLDAPSRRKVWVNFIQKLKPGTAQVSERDFDQLAETPLNGREIKNLIKTALVLAHRDLPLRLKHLEVVLDIRKRVADMDVADAQRDADHTDNMDVTNDADYADNMDVANDADDANGGDNEDDGYDDYDDHDDYEEDDTEDPCHCE